MANAPKDETYSDEETRKRADATLKVMLATPHKPHKPHKESKRVSKSR